ncbi:uncharacterized protein DEA37_0008875, partial [Paragonimus westermani]
LISRQSWKSIGRPAYKKTEHSAQNASGEKLALIGELDCDIECDDVHTSGTVYPTEHSKLNLLGLDWIEHLKLLDMPLNQFCSHVKLQEGKS